jgi:hypothetical protein
MLDVDENECTEGIDEKLLDAFEFVDDVRDIGGVDRRELDDIELFDGNWLDLFISEIKVVFFAGVFS